MSGGLKLSQIFSGGAFVRNRIKLARPPRLGSLLVHSDVVHPHLLREFGRGIRCSWPIAAYCQIQDDVKRMIENPFLSSGQLCRNKSRVEILVRIEAHHVRLPLDREHVEIVRELRPTG